MFLLVVHDGVKHHVHRIRVSNIEGSLDLLQGQRPLDHILALFIVLCQIRPPDLAGPFRSKQLGDGVVSEDWDFRLSLLNFLGDRTLGLVEPLVGIPPVRVGEILSIFLLPCDVVLEEHVVGLNILAAPSLCLGVEERLFPQPFVSLQHN